MGIFSNYKKPSKPAKVYPVGRGVGAPPDPAKLEKLRKEIESIKGTEDEQRKDLQNYVMTLDVA